MSDCIKVLSIDGGGIRGIVPALILAEIEKRKRQPIAKLFDVIAGTSTGGILALGLTRPQRKGAKTPKYSAKDLVGLYRDRGEEVFSRPVWHRIHSLGGFGDEKYPAAGLETVLGEYLGTTMLSEAVTTVLIPSYDVHGRDPIFFKSHKAKADPARDFPMTVVARAATAAPTYFEPLQVRKRGEPTPDNPDPDYALIDGGVFVNNPALCGYIEARTIDQAKPAAERCADFLVVSLGTGLRVRKLPYDRVKDWGLAGWARPILDVVFDGVADAVNYHLQQLLPAGADGKPRYYRFQAELGRPNDDLDDASERNIRELIDLGRAIVRDRGGDIRTLCRQL